MENAKAARFFKKRFFFDQNFRKMAFFTVETTVEFYSPND